MISVLILVIGIFGTLKNTNMKKKHILILGASGMLGSMVLDFFAKDRSFSVFATVRDQDLLTKLQKKYPQVNFTAFDVAKESLQKLESVLTNVSWVINNIGIIKPYIHDTNPHEVERAIKINSLFPLDLVRAAEKYDFHIIQIATDCVFSGLHGNYLERDLPDATDVYGKTKSLGEIHDKRMLNVRCSVIGPELKTHSSLLDWFLRQPNGTALKGFTNHLWNGITSLHFAKLCRGIIQHNIVGFNVQHIRPLDIVTKYELLKIFAEVFERKDLSISPAEGVQAVDRSLSTLNPERNEELWKAMGYKKPLTIKQMVKELSQYEFPV